MIRSTSAASVLIVCVLTTSADARSETLALAGGRLVDGYGGPPLDNAVVLVKGSRIDAIGRVGAIAIPSGARVIDTNGMTVMPGLWESHGHLLHIGAGNPGEFVSHFADRKTEIMAIVAELNLMAGVTSFRNASGPLEEQKQLREAIESGKRLGPRLYLTGRSIENHPERDRAADGVSNFYRLTTPQAAREAAEQLIASNIDQIQIGGFWKLPVLEALVDAAHRAGIGVDAEARHVSAMRTAVRAGVDRLHVVFAASPLSEYSDEDMRLLVRGAKPVALGPSSNILRGPYFVSTMEMRQSYVRVLDFPEILDHPRFRKQFPPDIYDYMRRSWSCAFYLFIRQPNGSEVSPAARNTLDSARIPRASKLLICGLFQKGRALAQDGHRPCACQTHHRRLGGTEDRSRDHGVPAQPWHRHGARGVDLQDLRRGCRSGHDREPVPPCTRYSRHRVQDRRHDRHEARHRENSHDPGSRGDFPCAHRGDG